MEYEAEVKIGIAPVLSSKPAYMKHMPKALDLSLIKKEANIIPKSELYAPLPQKEPKHLPAIPKRFSTIRESIIKNKLCYSA